jgi:hypothetical protein
VTAPVVAALVLGSSLASPKLVYLFSLPASSSTSQPPPPAGARRDGARRLLRAMASEGSDMFAVDPGLCRLHVLIRARRDAALPAPHFRPRPGLALQLRRAHVAVVDASAAGATAAVDEPAACSSSGGGGCDPAEPPPWVSGLVRGWAPPPPRVPPAERRPQPAPARPVLPVTEHDERSPLPPPPLPPPPGPGAAGACDGGHTIWWQSTALVKGFRLGSRGVGEL